MNRAVRTPADEALDADLKARYDAYIAGSADAEICQKRHV
jgi:hypothetical protein